jgi:multimeric flavodoxin WrbA
MRTKNAVIVLGSPRKNGNSAALAREAAEGLMSEGLECESFFLHKMNIKPCDACDACRGSIEDPCVIQDDMQVIYPKLRESRLLVIAGPVYFAAVSAQTKLFMDRCYALGGPEGSALKGKRVGTILTYEDPDPFVSGAVNALRMFQDVYNYVGATIVGNVYGSALEPGEIKTNRDVMRKAFDLGKKLADFEQ